MSLVLCLGLCRWRSGIIAAKNLAHREAGTVEPSTYFGFCTTEYLVPGTYVIELYGTWNGVTYILYSIYTDENRDRVGLVILYLQYYAMMRWASKQKKRAVEKRVNIMQGCVMRYS